MEIVAAAGTFTQSDLERDKNQQDNPKAKDGSHGLVGRGYSVGNKDGRNVHQYGEKKQPAAAPGLFHNCNICRRINRAILHSTPPTIPYPSYSGLIFFSENEIPDRKNRSSEGYKEEVGYNNTDAVINQ
jgi:hypothetical protein